MTTREELHALVDSLSEDDINAVVQVLKPFAEQRPCSARPRFIGMGRSRHSGTAARSDETLRETGFGE